MSPIRTLVVDDNPADVDLTLEALHGANAAVEVAIARDGQQAVDFLHNRGVYAAALPPHLVFLDVNLPRIKGNQVLEEMRADERLRHIPVIMLTSSQRDAEIRRLYELGANCCITKPLCHADFARLILQAFDAWAYAAQQSPAPALTAR